MSRPEDETGGFLGRWARRKQEVQRGAAEPSADAAPAENHVVDAGGAQLPLPSLDDIGPAGDVSAFFQKHVPEALRNAALRKLWVTDPDIRNFIEMADYQWDFNNPDAIPGWGSSVEGFDVKAMVERVFAGSPTKVVEDPAVEDEAGENAAEADETPDALSQEAGETANITLESKHFPQAGTPDEHDLIQNEAIQNSSVESKVYENQRKRHGGALPS